MGSLSIARTIPTVDVSAFTSKASDAQRLDSGHALVQALHSFGFVKVTGHGLEKHEIREALGWVKKMFDLPEAEKMKAPHPLGPFPHRGYSGIGKEKVYSRDEMKTHESGKNAESSIRNISDFKESYEIGSESDMEQQNVWLPEETLPNFRGYMCGLHDRLTAASKIMSEAISIGLGLGAEERTALANLQHQYQLRLLHYPAVSKQRLVNDVFARLPAHNDWSAFTMVFQDENGGLQLQDAETKDYLPAYPEEGALVLNVGDMMQRFTNGYFTSALHRVLVPDPEDVPESGIPARYSIPFFVAPKSSHTIATLPRFITADSPAKYEPVRFDEYSSVISKYSYGDKES